MSGSNFQGIFCEEGHYGSFEEYIENVLFKMLDPNTNPAKNNVRRLLDISIDPNTNSSEEQSQQNPLKNSKRSKIPYQKEGGIDTGIEHNIVGPFAAIKDLRS